MTNKKSAGIVPSSDTISYLADMMPVKIAILDSEMRFVYANQILADWLGADRSDLIGSVVTEFMRRVDEDGDAQSANLINEILEDGIPRDYEVTVLQLKTGKERILRSKVVRHENGEMIYVFIRDITDTITSEINAARYKAVVDTAGEGVIMIDATGAIRTFNKSAEALFGYSRDEVVRRNVNMLMPDFHADHHDLYIQRYLETREPRVIGKGSVEAEGLHKNGSTFPVDLAVAVFEVQGKTYFTGVVRDISERKRLAALTKQTEINLEAELQKRGRALDQIFNTSSDILGILGFDGQFQSLSPSAEKLFSLPVAELVLREFSRFIRVDDQAQLKLAIDRAINGENVRVDLRINTGDEQVRWSSWSMRALEEDEIILVVGRDVTDEKALADDLRQSQKMEAIGQLTGGIAHDFNNLMAAISGSLDLMDRRIGQGRYQETEKYVNAARQAVVRAAQLTQRLLAFSRRQPLNPLPVAANDLINSLLDLFDRSVGPSITVETSLSRAWPIFCDNNQLENSLLNCVINARDALPDGGRITLTTANITEAKCRAQNIPKGEYVMISVTDNGSGMSEETLSRAFDPFFTTKSIGKGTGLGLSMLYGFVNQSNGHVRIQSKPGSGTVIRMFFPRYHGEVITQTEAPEERVLPKVGGGQPMLIVEDESLVRDVLVEIMETTGFAVTAVEDAEKALAIIETDAQIDVMLSDVGLPGMNGRELARQARQHRPDLRILFLTGFAPEALVRDKFLDSGMDMMTKPFDAEEVVLRVEKLMRR